MFTIRSLFTSQIVLSTFRSKIYNEIFDTNHIFHDMTAFIEPEKNIHQVATCIITIGCASLLIETIYNYKIERLKDTTYYKSIEKQIEIFIFVFLTILFRNVENAI